MDPRQLTLLPVAPGPTGIAAVSNALQVAMAGGPAFCAVNPAQPPPVVADRAVHPDTGVVIPTSGSTGPPRLVEITLPALAAAAAASATALGGGGLWLSTLPATGIGGLMTIVRSLDAGVEPLAWEGVGGGAPFTAHSFIPAVAAARRRADALGVGCFTSLVPTQVVRLQQAGMLAELAAFDAVLVGGDALSAAVAAALGAAGVRFVTTYGATETCGGVVYDGRPLEGAQLRIEAAPSGRIEVGGPMLASGYVGDPGATEAAFHDGWFRSSDLGVWENGLLRVTGRCDDIVKCGGSKVSLARIAEVLREHPGVLDAAVIAESDEQWGTLPRAAVVPIAGPDPTANELIQQLRAAVAAAVPFRPGLRRIDLVDQLPTTAGGKRAREAGD